MPRVSVQRYERGGKMAFTYAACLKNLSKPS